METYLNNQTRYLLVTGILLAGIIGVMMLPAIPQDPAYHDFGAALPVFGIPNFWNVASNIPFAIVGVIGLAGVFHRLNIVGAPRRIADLMYVAFSAGVLLTAFGSSYYHWQPANQTLVWDRLPMTVAFASLLCLVLWHYGAPRFAAFLFAPLLAVGVWSVAYWASTELAGEGDLRPYALVQFLPLLILPFIIHGRQSAELPGRYLWMALGWYVVAKLFEGFDGWFAETWVVIGGHPFKHVFAAFATFCIVLAYIKSTPGKRTDVPAR